MSGAAGPAGRSVVAALAVLAASCASCGGGSGLPHLSDYGLFGGALKDHLPAPGVLPYEVTSVLYADGAGKYRYMKIPAGGTIHFEPSGRWTFPVGTIFVKTFDYPLDARRPEMGERLLETRLLSLEPDGTWSTRTYVWNEAQTDADQAIAGTELSVQRIDESGAQVTSTYRVPNLSQCKSCHSQNGRPVPLGPRTRQLNRASSVAGGGAGSNQLEHLASLGLFDGPLPEVASLEHLADPHGTAPVADRARAYLEANCAHCHNEAGYAASTALRLELETTAAVDLGLCRPPVAAGPAAGSDLFDVVPGDPDHSIMIYRMKSNDPEIKMPQLPLSTSDSFGVGLVSDWIAGLSGSGCP